MANRSTRRREKKITKVEQTEEVLQMSTTEKVFIALSVLCILGMFYLLTLYITNKHTDKPKEEDTTTTEQSINYEKINIGKSFSVSSDDYLVLFYDTSMDNASEYSNLISTYKAKEEHLPIYYVDMNDSFAKKYATSEESNKNPTNAAELLINGSTLIKFSNNSVVEYIEGEESIKSYLG